MCFVIIIIPKKERNRSLTKFVQRAVFLYVDPCSEIMPLAWRVGKINFPYSIVQTCAEKICYKAVYWACRKQEKKNLTA